MRISSQLSIRVPLATALFLLAAGVAAQHPAPIAISNPAATSPERTAFNARMSPDGLFVAYSTTGGSGATATHSLFVRRADASAPSVQVTTILTSTTTPFFPNIPFAWRQATPASSSRLVFGERTSAVGAYNLREFDPATSSSVTRTTFAAPAVGRNFLFLQLHPCGNRVSGVLTNFSAFPTPVPSLDRVWHVDLTSAFAVPVFPAGATATGQLTALELTPNESVGLFMEHPSNGTRVFQYSVSTGAVTQVANATASTSTGGCLDNTRAYGIDSATFDLASWSLPPSASNVPITRDPAVILQAAAAPGHLVVASGTKRFIAYLNSLNEIRMTASDYGGEILLATPPTGFTGCLNPSLDGAASRVAFIATGAQNQVFVVPSLREIRATFTSGGTTSYSTTVPCDASELCVLAASLGLAAVPVPFGPPGTGTFDLDANNIILAASFGVPLTLTTASQPYNPSLIGTLMHFQAGRLDPATLAFLNTTRVATVRYF